MIKNIKNIKQNGIFLNFSALLIYIIFILLGIWIYPKQDLTVHGVFLPQVPGASRTDPSKALPASNIIFLNQSQNNQGQMLGLINTSVHFDALNEHSDQMLYQASVDQAKKIAAQSSLGNAIKLIQVSAGGSASSPLDSFMVQFWVLKI